MKIRSTRAFGLLLIVIERVPFASAAPPGASRLVAWGDLHYDLIMAPSRPSTQFPIRLLDI
jgi:hypothetical protein